MSKRPFKAKYGYDLAPAKTMEQMRDIAECLAARGATLAGKVLETDFYGIVLKASKAGRPRLIVGNFLKNYGGDIRRRGQAGPRQPTECRRVEVYADLWKFAPPGLPNFLVDATVMAPASPPDHRLVRFCAGVDKPGVSAYAGKFVCACATKAGNETKRSADAELMVISGASKNPEATFLPPVARQQEGPRKLIDMGKAAIRTNRTCPAIKDGRRSTRRCGHPRCGDGEA